MTKKERIIKEMLTQKGTLKKSYFYGLSNLKWNHKKGHTFTNLKSWKNGWNGLEDREYFHLITILKTFGITFKEVNISKRGGVEGDSIQLLKNISKYDLKIINELLNIKEI